MRGVCGHTIRNCPAYILPQIHPTHRESCHMCQKRHDINRPKRPPAQHHPTLYGQVLLRDVLSKKIIQLACARFHVGFNVGGSFRGSGDGGGKELELGIGEGSGFGVSPKLDEDDAGGLGVGNGEKAREYS